MKIYSMNIFEQKKSLDQRVNVMHVVKQTQTNTHKAEVLHQPKNSDWSSNHRTISHIAILKCVF